MTQLTFNGIKGRHNLINKTNPFFSVPLPCLNSFATYQPTIPIALNMRRLLFMFRLILVFLYFQTVVYPILPPTEAATRVSRLPNP